jgi:hypothetical protein
MAKFPHPPPVADLVGLGVRADERRQLAVGTTLWRLYFQGGPHPTAWHDFRHFGPTAGRFDHHQPPPQPQARAILYAAELGPACVAEVYQDTRTIDRRRRSPWLVAFVLASPLTMLDLHLAQRRDHAHPRLRLRLRRLGRRHRFQGFLPEQAWRASRWRWTAAIGPSTAPVPTAPSASWVRCSASASPAAS